MNVQIRYEVSHSDDLQGRRPVEVRNRVQVKHLSMLIRRESRARDYSTIISRPQEYHCSTKRYQTNLCASKAPLTFVFGDNRVQGKHHSSLQRTDER